MNLFHETLQSGAELFHGVPQSVLLVKGQAHPERVRHSLPRRQGAARGTGQDLRQTAYTKQYLIASTVGFL